MTEPTLPPSELRVTGRPLGIEVDPNKPVGLVVNTPDCSHDHRVRAVLFNDVSRILNGLEGEGAWLPFSARRKVATALYEQGWRREVRPEDVTP